LARVAPVYLERRKSLALDDALWRYWTFQELPLGINLPMLVSGIEILATAWFASPFSISKGRFTPKSDFQDLLRSNFEDIRTRLNQAASKKPGMAHLSDRRIIDALVERLRNSFEMGPNARIREFFNELGITPSKGESRALQARNRQVHTAGEKGTGKELWQLSECLRTLFHKIILRLLDYTGDYLEWGTTVPKIKRLRDFPKRGLIEGRP
jgi:hypothetical protein